MDNAETSKNTDTSLLSEVGLSDKESVVYELLLKSGVVPAIKLIEGTGYKRATVYSVLDELIKKSLVEKDESEPVVRFRAKHPYALRAFLDGKVSKMRETEQKLDAVFPGLIQMFHKAQSRPGVTFYEGEKEVTRAYDEILAEKKEILAYVYFSFKMNNKLQEYWDKFLRIRKRNKIKIRAIGANDASGLDYQNRDKSEYRETRLIDKKQFPITIEKNICGNKVALLSLSKDEMIGVVIESEEIAKTERIVFDYIWNTLK